MSIDLSLARVRQLFSSLPAYTRPTIHVAGTNGKGSVTAILSSIFVSSGISVGRFNSPHLIHVWDAISINGCSVAEDTYRPLRNHVERVNSTNQIEASSFEIMTATAAQIFEQARVHVAIFEVGLGGRLDATNVLPDDTILVSAITSIDLDHQQFLGITPAAIAREKAGIARSAKPCVLGPQTHPEVQPVVQDVVHAIGGRFVKAIELAPQDSENFLPPSLDSSQVVTAPFPPWNTTLELVLPLRGAHQRQNLATALTVLSVIIEDRSTSPLEVALNDITPSTLYTGVLKTTWPGRLERVALVDPPLVILIDGAHNPASAAALQSYLSRAASTASMESTPSSRSPCVFILALSHSPPKTPLETLAPLLRPGDRVAFIPFSDVEDMPWVKNVPLPELESVGRNLVEGGEVKLFGRVSNEVYLGPLKRALKWASDVAEGDEVVLAGSLYLVADLHRVVIEQGRNGS